MKRIAVFPGSFDPITKGHESIIRRAMPLFDEIIVAIGVNSNKSYFFSLEQRKRWIENTFADLQHVSVETFSGLTVEFCKAKNANYIIRGLRSSVDLNFERSIAQMNFAMSATIETVFLVTEPKFSAINSTIIRDIVRNKGNVTEFVPVAVANDLLP